MQPQHLEVQITTISMLNKMLNRSPQADMEDMVDLANMRHLLMERVQGVMTTCCEFRNSLERYSYLYVDDRKEFIRHFLLYGHMVASHEVYAEDGVSEHPPSLENFREQVDKWVLVRWRLSVCLCFSIPFMKTRFRFR